MNNIALMKRVGCRRFSREAESPSILQVFSKTVLDLCRTKGSQDRLSLRNIIYAGERIALIKLNGDVPVAWVGDYHVVR